MYSNQSFDEKVTSSKRSEDYDLCNTETGQKFVIKWSPQDGARYLSRNRYASPRSMSKSVPRRKRGIVRYSTNRSLNFEVGSRRSDTYRSPISSSDSNVSVDGDQYLSRSAKILRALNINYRPLQSAKLGSRKISKSLNFDLSPSPKRLTKFGKSPRNSSLKTYPSPLPKINKTLNFDTSSNDSNSVHNSSVESIDENQNQTPSQRNRSAKKSLNYPTPNSDKSFGSPDSSVHSPMLRSGLKEKIDDIVLASMTPNIQSTRRSQMKSRYDDFGASTPRNLFNDFDEDDDNDENDDDDRPQTPENGIRIIPESMSAIKKSHKKERVLGRLGKAVAYQVESCSGSEAFTHIATDSSREESRPTTPPVTIDQYQSPQCALNSIKQSHKKDKSKRRSFAYHSEDEMSDTGSIFDYTGEANATPSTGSLSSRDKSNRDFQCPEIRISHASDDDKGYEEEENSPASSKARSEVNSSLDDGTARKTGVEDESVTPPNSFNSPEALRDVDRADMQQGSSKQAGDATSPLPADNAARNPPENSTTGDTARPVTPENRINFLQRIMTDSIKKSHKKIKDINRKTLFKPRVIHDEAEPVRKRDHTESEEVASTEDRERAVTPENTNSSRLLLSQFSSVKKSHRKDKHRRMVSETMHRKKFLYDALSTSDSEAPNSSAFPSTGDLPNVSPPRSSPNNVKRRKSDANDISSDNSTEVYYQTLDKSPMEDVTAEAGVGALPSSDLPKSSPKKRKNLLNVSSASGVSQSSSHVGSISMEYESAEEEFKIFTPIKKRKSLVIITPAARRICQINDLSPEEGKSMDEASPENGASRCSTPTTARSKSFKAIDTNFKTPERNVSGDYSSPVLREIDNVNDPSGRSTPQNSSTVALIPSMASIKKSHKKDKRCNMSRRSMIFAQEEQYESEATSSFEKDRSKDLSKSLSYTHSSPQPSTSYGSEVDRAMSEAEKETDTQTKTPPNCLKVKTYLRLLQTASIKRSHKKVRERKKFRSIVADPELSDDGSLFDEAEKSLALENESLKESGEGRENEEMQALSPKMDVAQNSEKGKGQYYSQDVAPTHYSGNASNDGSIFDPEEKLESPYKSGNSDEQESSPA